MKTINKKTGLGIVMLFALYLATPAVAETLRLPPDVKAALLAEMHDHVRNLDDVMSALAEQDFAKASAIATVRMTQGHARWEQMQENGETIEAIRAAQQQFAKMSPAARKEMMHGAGAGQKKPALDQFVPADFKAMGKEFHTAAAQFADDAARAASPPTQQDYVTASTHMQAMLAACRGCHATWDIE